MAKRQDVGFWSFENFRSLFIMLFVIFAIRYSVVSPYFVPTASMEPTIKVGDRLIANKLAYQFKVPFTDIVAAEWGTPQRGDIIVFQYPKDPAIDYVKRVVGVAGDKLQIKDDILYINGEPQPRTDHNQDRSILTDIFDPEDQKLLFRETLNGVEHWVMQNKDEYRNFATKDWPPYTDQPYVVPENAVFCIGDNRDNSADSRSWNHVPLEYVRGKAMFVFWSAYTPIGKTMPIFRWNRFGEGLK